MFAAIALAWKLKGFRGVFGLVPRSVWIGLAVVIALLGAYWYHGHRVSAFKKDVQRAQMAADNDYWKKKLDKAHKEALAWKTKYDTNASQLSQARRNEYEADLRRSAALASSLLNTGPGKARCGQVDNSGVSTSPSGHDEGRGAGSVAVGGVPNQERTDLIALPFVATIEAFKLCSANRSEVVTWRNHDNDQRALRNGSVHQP